MREDKHIKECNSFNTEFPLAYFFFNRFFFLDISSTHNGDKELNL